MKIPQILQIPLKGILILAASLAGCSKSSNNGNSSTDHPTPSPVLSITSINPTHATGGAKDTIVGTGFDATNSSITINGQKVTVVSATSTQLVISIPALSGSGKITVTSGNNTVAGPVFTYDTLWTGKVVADNLTDPRHLAIDSNGNVYFTYASAIGWIAASTGTVSDFASTHLNKPMGIAADANGNIFVSDPNVYKIYRYNQTGYRDSFPAGNYYFWALTLDHAGNLYGASDNAVGTTDVIKYSPAGVVTPLATHVGFNLAFSTGIAIDANSTLYLATTGFEDFLNNKTTFFTISASGSVGQYSVPQTGGGSDIAWSNGELYFCGSDGSLYRANSSNATLITKGLINPFGIVVDKQGNVYVASFYANGTGPGKITKYTYQ
jgi:hypothetical protein